MPNSFYKIHNSILKLKALETLNDEVKTIIFQDNDVLDMFFNHYIIKIENMQRAKKTCDKGTFELSYNSIARDFSITRSKAQRLVKRFVDEGIIFKFREERNKTLYAYTTVYDNANKQRVDNEKHISKENKYINEIFDFWNSKGIIKHTKLNDKIKKAYDKARKDFSHDEIVKAIENYNEVIKSDFYYKHKFTLENFLKQSNAIYKFIDEGEIYINYLDKKNSTTNSSTNKNNYSQSICNNKNKYTQISEFV